MSTTMLFRLKKSMETRGKFDVSNVVHIARRLCIIGHSASTHVQICPTDSSPSSHHTPSSLTIRLHNESLLYFSSRQHHSSILPSAFLGLNLNNKVVGWLVYGIIGY